MSDVVTVQGVGIHSGRQSTVRLHRSDGPVRFRTRSSTFRPHLRYVHATSLATVLRHDGATVAVVEHLLAALHVMDVWSGLMIDVEGDEVPILDGSAEPWCEALADMGPFPDAPAPTRFHGDVEDGTSGRAWFDTAPGRSLDVTIDFAHPAIGRQRWSGTKEAWRGLASARTFGFEADAEALRAAGHALGASHENAIVFGDAGPLRPLRCVDEPVRHKALDALGDLYLLGSPFDGRLVVERGGHGLHHTLMRRALEDGSVEGVTS